MMNELRICLIQADLAWENRNQNLAHLRQMVEQSPSTDIVFLPEMFASGFTMNAAACAETADGESVQWMKDLARAQNTAVTGSLIIAEGGTFYNRLFWVEPDGKTLTYNKRHLFSLAGEEKVFTAGTENMLIEYKGWRIRPQICYDLRFPVWCRNTDDYDLLYFVANWPDRRVRHWQQLLVARAIENQSYVVGVNRVGKDGNGIEHSGHSAVIDAMGERLTDIQAGQECVKSITLSKDALTEVRTRFSFLADRDGFEFIN